MQRADVQLELVGASVALLPPPHAPRLRSHESGWYHDTRTASFGFMKALKYVLTPRNPCQKFRKRRCAACFVRTKATLGYRSTRRCWYIQPIHFRCLTMHSLQRIQVFLNYHMFLRKLAQEASSLALARGSKSVEAADIDAAAPEVLKQFRI